MNIIGMFLLMLALHILEDFHLQGIMAQMKQRKWWVDGGHVTDTERLYAHDYLMVLALHGIGWTFCVTLPMMWEMGFDIPMWFCAMFAVNAFVHCAVDHLKCNSLRINLIADQSIHIVQIAGMLTIYTVLA